MNKDPFPRHIVTGEYFCNRVEERKKLALLLSRGTNVWLQAHRRLGKSSLLMQVAEDMNNSGEKVVQDRCHFLFSSGPESIIKLLLKTIALLMGKVAQIDAHSEGYSKKDAIIDYISKQFSSRTLNVKLERGMPSISFEEQPNVDLLVTLGSAFKSLDEYATKADVRVVIVLDEFQELGKSKGGVEIESVIRDHLELSEATVFVFCGSERGLMDQSLNDQKRPLYNHTKPFNLERIEDEHYRKHLQKLALLNWNEELENEVINQILSCTHRHPYYVNSLCSDLWLQSSIPNIRDVEKEWQHVIDMAEREERELILKLSANEKSLLVELANNPSMKPQSNEAISSMGMASSSVNRALSTLIKKDVIEKTLTGGYQIINPIIVEMAKRNS